VTDIASRIYHAATPECLFIFGAKIDKRFAPEKVRLTIIATGIESDGQ
jgi:cell division GTPase FtsZ